MIVVALELLFNNEQVHDFNRIKTKFHFFK